MSIRPELVPEQPWRDLGEARKAVSNYIHRYYNPTRRHSTLDYLSPVEFELQYQASREEAA